MDNYEAMKPWEHGKIAEEELKNTKTDLNNIRTKIAERNGKNSDF